MKDCWEIGYSHSISSQITYTFSFLICRKERARNLHLKQGSKSVSVMVNGKGHSVAPAVGPSITYLVFLPNMLTQNLIMR